MKYFKASVLSVIIHVVVIGGLLFYTAIRGCLFKKQKVELVEFTIAVDPVEEEPPPPSESKVESPKPKVPEPKPDDIALQKKKPDPPKEQKKPEPKKPEKPKIEKGKRVTKTPPIKSTVKPKDKPPSEEEIKKFLNGRIPIKPGERNSLPQNDLSLNYSLITKALYDAWNQPSREAAGFRPAEIAFSVGLGGRIQNPRLQTSSGSAVFDQSALEAVRRVGSIPDLSAEFINQFKGQDLTIEFKLSD